MIGILTPISAVQVRSIHLLQFFLALLIAHAAYVGGKCLLVVQSMSVTYLYMWHTVDSLRNRWATRLMELVFEPCRLRSVPVLPEDARADQRKRVRNFIDQVPLQFSLYGVSPMLPSRDMNYYRSVRRGKWVFGTEWVLLLAGQRRPGMLTLDNVSSYDGPG